MLVEQHRLHRFLELRPVYDHMVAHLNSNGGKSDGEGGSKIPRSRLFELEDVMPAVLIPASLQPFTRTEAITILDAIPHLNGAGWVINALINRVISAEKLERLAGRT